MNGALYIPKLLNHWQDQAHIQYAVPAVQGQGWQSIILLKLESKRCKKLTVERLLIYIPLSTHCRKSGQQCRGVWDLRMKTGRKELFFCGGFRRTKKSAIGVGQILRLCLLKFWLQWERSWIKTTGGLRMWPHVGCLGETDCQQLGQANNFCLLKIKPLFSNAQQRLLLMTAAGIDWNQN